MANLSQCRRPTRLFSSPGSRAARFSVLGAPGNAATAKSFTSVPATKPIQSIIIRTSGWFCAMPFAGPQAMAQNGSTVARKSPPKTRPNRLRLKAPKFTKKTREASAFVVPEIQAIDDGRWEKFIADPILKDWKIPLHKIRRMRPHVLSEREERLLALGAAALDGYDDAFSQLTNVDMKFGVLIDGDGREKPLTQSTYSSFLLKRDRDLRERAFNQFYEEFKDHQFTLAASLGYSVKGDVFRARARNFPSALEASLFIDDMPIAVYDGLINAVREGIAPLLRYYELRRRVLDLDQLRAYDTYV